VRELVKKVVHLADAIYCLTTAAYGSLRGERCGLPFRELVARIPQLGACQVQEYLTGGVGGCYKNTPQQMMNAPFVVRESKNCSAACHKGLDALLDIYGCCAATDRNAQAEWWQRVGHPRFKTFLVDWTPTVQELFMSPSSSVEEDTCADSARAYTDCTLPKCKHGPGGADPQWKGWMDYPPPCCRMECPGRATKSFPYSCSCICPLGFVGEWCNTTQTHVLAEMQLTGISARSFEKKGKQDVLIDNIALVVQVPRESVEIDFFQDATKGLPPLPPGARLDPAGGWARRDGGNASNEKGEGRRQIEEGAALIVRFRVLVQTERGGLRIAQMLSAPSKLQVVMIEAGLVKGERRKPQPSLVNTFLPMTMDATGKHLCDNVLYACPVFGNPKLNTTDVGRVAGVSLNALSIVVSSSSALCVFVAVSQQYLVALWLMFLTCLMMVLTCLMMAWWQIIVVCPVIFFTVLYMWCSHYEKLVVLLAVLRMFCASCRKGGRKHSTRAGEWLRRGTSKKQPSEDSAYVASSQFEEMTAARRLRPELHSEGLTAWCVETDNKYQSAGGIVFTRGLGQSKRTNMPSTLSALHGGGFGPVSSAIYGDVVFVHSGSQGRCEFDSVRAGLHVQRELLGNSRKLESMENTRRIDQVLDMLHTKRYCQPKYVVSYLQVSVFFIARLRDCLWLRGCLWLCGSEDVCGIEAVRGVHSHV